MAEQARFEPFTDDELRAIDRALDDAVAIDRLQDFDPDDLDSLINDLNDELHRRGFIDAA